MTFVYDQLNLVRFLTHKFETTIFNEVNLIHQVLPPKAVVFCWRGQDGTKVRNH